VLEALLKHTMFDLPSMANIEKCRVDEELVLGDSEIHLEQRL
jgi:ATP-dependent protease Clp ATPase subunit